MDHILRKKQRQNYTVIDNEILADEKLSWRARGIAAHLLTKPDDWKINMDYLYQSAPEGRQAVRTAIAELATHGYLKRVKKSENGKVKTVTYLSDYAAFIDHGTSEERLNGYIPDVPTGVQKSTSPQSESVDFLTDQKPDCQETDGSGSPHVYSSLKNQDTHTRDDLVVSDLGSTRDLQDTTHYVRGGAEPDEQPAQDALLPEELRDDVVVADAVHAPSSYNAWREHVAAAKNKASALRWMVETLYPANEPPTYGYIAKVAKEMGGAGMMVKYLWECSTMNVAGDPVSYAYEAWRRRQRGRSAVVSRKVAPDKGDNVVDMNSLWEGVVY